MAWENEFQRQQTHHAFNTSAAIEDELKHDMMGYFATLCHVMLWGDNGDRANWRLLHELPPATDELSTLENSK